MLALGCTFECGVQLPQSTNFHALTTPDYIPLAAAGALLVLAGVLVAREMADDLTGFDGGKCVKYELQQQRGPKIRAEK